jgi:hypothetical protein
MNDQEQEYQWEVTDHAPNEELIKALFNRLAIAFAFSQPIQDENEYWRYAQREDIEARFAAGENTIRVAWAHLNPDHTYVTIRRL